MNIKYDIDRKRYVDDDTGRFVSKKVASKQLGHTLMKQLEEMGTDETRTPASSIEPKKLWRTDKSKRHASPRRDVYQYHNEKPKFVIQILGYKGNNVVCDMPKNLKSDKVLGLLDMAKDSIMHGGISDD